MNKLLLLCYKGGYCGDFITNLALNGFGLSSDYSVEDPLINKYRFDNSGWGLPTKGLTELFEMHMDPVYEDLFRNIAATSLKNHDYYKNIVSIFNICHDQDFGVFKQNVMHFMRQSITLKSPLTVGNVHFYRDVENFVLKDIHEGVNPILIGTEDLKYHYLFNCLLYLKTKYDYDLFNPKTVNEKQMLLDNIVKDKSIVTPLPNMEFIDAGKLLFEDCEYENVLVSMLERLGGVQFNLDVEKFENYKQITKESLETFLGSSFLYDDYKTLASKIHDRVMND